jgi:hypothetical protein
MRGEVVRAGARACLLGLTSLAAAAQDATPAARKPAELQELDAVLRKTARPLATQLQ